MLCQRARVNKDEEILECGKPAHFAIVKGYWKGCFICQDCVSELHYDKIYLKVIEDVQVKSS